MFLTGIPVALQGAFSIATIAISIPFDVITLSFVESLIRGRVKFATPMLFSLGAVILFIIGGITGVFLSSPVLDRVFRGSYFVVSHFHYVMVGAAIFGIIAGIYYWLPRMTGHMYNERLGKIHFLISFVGFNILYFPMNLLYDMPRRIFTYPNVGDWATLNGIASVGAFVFAGAQILLAYNLINTWYRGPVAAPNPWDSPDLEWTSHAEGFTPAVETGTSPPPGGWIGHLSTPTAGAVPAAHGGEGYHGHLSSRPLEISLGALVFFIGAGVYPAISGIVTMAAGAVVFLYALLGWARDDLKERFVVPAEVEGDRWPFSAVPKLKLGMWVFLSSEVVLFGSFLGAYIFIRAAAPAWPAPGSIHDIPLGTLNTVVLVTSGLTMFLAIQAIRQGDQRRLLGWLATTFVLGSVFMGIKVSEWVNLGGSGFTLGSTPEMSLAASAYYIIVGLHGAHVTAGILMMVYLMKKTGNGSYTKDSHEAIENFGLYWAFVDIIWCFVFPLFYLL
jgi:cytochrome c oxidase subunit I+III